jgi:hypothetical protein
MKRWFIVPVATLSLTTLALADPLTLTVHTDQTTKTVSTGIYGQFLEHIFNSVHGGLWGDQILNGTLELRPPMPQRGATAPAAAPATPPATVPGAITPRNWEFAGAADEVSVDWENPLNAQVSVRIAPKAGGVSATGPGILQRNIALKGSEKYTFSLYARGSGSVIAAF